MAASAGSAEGLLVGHPNRPWRVGKLLGTGACGSVHELIYEGKSTCSSNKTCSSKMKYVIKIAPVPPWASSSSSSSSKRKKMTQLEKNANLISHEYALYNGALNDLRGSMVPDIPTAVASGVPPAFGNVQDFRFLVMERMEHPLSDVIPMLIANMHRHKSSSSRTAPTINFGDVATAMLSCIEALHKKGFVFVDVKPENFMLSYSATTKGSGSTDNTNISNRIRIIDFGLASNYRNLVSAGHQQDTYPNAQLVGTPLYASLNVLRGHSPSRRDDIEALGYVLGEMLIRLLHMLLFNQDGTQKKEDASSTTSTTGGCTANKGSRQAKKNKELEHGLSWNQCKSDTEVLRVKAQEIEIPDDGTSTFFDQMKLGGNVKAERAMREYFTMARQLKHPEKPDYEKFKQILGRIVIKASHEKPVGKVGSVRGSEVKKRASKTASVDVVHKLGRTTRTAREGAETKTTPGVAGTKRPSPVAARGRGARQEFGFDEDIPPTEGVAKKRRSRRNATTQEQLNEVSSSATLEVIEIEDEQDKYHSCDTGVEEMEWESLPDENEAPHASKSSRHMSSETDVPMPNGKRGLGLQVIVIGGPHQGESFFLEHGVIETCTIGKSPTNPKSKNGMTGSFALAHDSKTAPSHTKLVLNSSNRGRVLSIRVNDLKSTGGTYLNGKIIPKGGARQAFANDKIQIGETVLQIKNA